MEKKEREKSKQKKLCLKLCTESQTSEPKTNVNRCNKRLQFKSNSFQRVFFGICNIVSCVFWFLYLCELCFGQSYVNIS